VKLYFCKSNDIGGFLIRLFTFSRWNHVAIGFNGTVYEAVSGAGVRKIPESHFRWPEMEVVEIDAPNPLAAVNFLEQQVGKPYDWMALVALPFGRNWQSPFKWFCSELVAKAVVMTGQPNFFIKKHRIFPSHLWAVAPFLKKKRPKQ